MELFDHTAKTTTNYLTNKMLLDKPRPAIGIATIGPAEAAALLQNNKRNRPIKKASVKKLVREIENGRWELQTDAIGIDVDGNIINGQHRLHAIILTGATLEVPLMTGLKSDAFTAMDTGARRSGSDTLSVEGYTDTGVLAGMSMMLYHYIDRGCLSHHVVLGNVSNKEILDIVRAYPKLQNIATRAQELYRTAQPKNLLEPRVFALTLMMFNHVPNTGEWLEKMALGAQLEEGSPLMAYRNRLLNDRAGQSSNSNTKGHVIVRIAGLVTTMNDMRSGRTRLRLPRFTDPYGELPQPNGNTLEQMLRRLE